MTEETDLILGVTHEELKENIAIAAIMSGVSFFIVLTGMFVRHYVQGKISP